MKSSIKAWEFKVASGTIIEVDKFRRLILTVVFVFLTNASYADFCVTVFWPYGDRQAFTSVFDIDPNLPMFSSSPNESIDTIDEVPLDLRTWSLNKKMVPLAHFELKGVNRNWSTVTSSIAAYQVPFTLTEEEKEMTAGRTLHFFNLSLDMSPYSASFLLGDFDKSDPAKKILFGVARKLKDNVPEEVSDTENYRIGGVCVKNADAFRSLPEDAFAMDVEYAFKELDILWRMIKTI